MGVRARQTALNVVFGYFDNTILKSDMPTVFGIREQIYLLGVSKTFFRMNGKVIKD